MPGKLIVIEGLDGSGKSTQWEMLKKSIVPEHQPLFMTFPNYDSESGKIINKYLAGEFGGNNGSGLRENTAYSASSFYAIDRYISYKTLWGVEHRAGRNIISARYTSSNAIYQMTKLPKKEWQSFLDWLYDYEHQKLCIPKPDLTVFLDVPIEISQELLEKRYKKAETKGKKDIHEGDVGYLKKCREAALFTAERESWMRVDCVKSGILRTPEDINHQLSGIIRKELQNVRV
ncbi:MAG: deoxynucleoside kinase [Oscillospiraceae bacterium]|nr:deoxynucleoside kinase [Oscillospiraceae bacterium]